MSEPFLAEIKIVGFNFAPRGWALCDGQILPINQNQSLYSLLGTTYGGDGRTTFALPELRGRTPIHKGSSNGASHPLGQKTGEERHTLSLGEIPSHDHGLRGTNSQGNGDQPENNVLARASLVTYGPAANLVGMDAQSVANTGGGQSHENMMPFLTLNFAIALQGLFPSRN